MNKTNIAWTDYTWNPTTGCTPVSDGCKNCYAKTVHERFYDTPFSEIQFHDTRLNSPFQRKKSAKIFVGSMTDIFQSNVPFEWIDRIMEVIYHSPQHTFQILTKRPMIMKKYFENRKHYANMANVWIGVTVENQKEANERIPALLRTPADKRFVSIEPMIDTVDLENIKGNAGSFYQVLEPIKNSGDSNRPALDWVIVGGETGAKSKVREMNQEWVIKIYRDCRNSSIPFFFKQWGTHKPKQSYEFENIQEFPNA